MAKLGEGKDVVEFEALLTERTVLAVGAIAARFNSRHQSVRSIHRHGQVMHAPTAHFQRSAICCNVNLPCRWRETVKLVPPRPNSANPSQAEFRVFELLKHTQMPGATAYHSLNLSEHEYKRVGEIDFLLCTRKGILVVEVKGGGVARADGIWTYTDRWQRTHRSSEGPFEQARSAMFSLERSLSEKTNPDLVRGTVFGFVVITPDCDLDLSTVEWAPETAIGRRSIISDSGGGINDSLSAALDYWSEKSPGKVRLLPQESMAEFGRFLRPDFERVPPLGSRVGNTANRMAKLTSEQYHALDLLEEADRVLFSGGAGTGKSFLAVEAARRSAAQGESVALLCARSEFAAFLTSRLENEAVTVATIDSLDRKRQFDLVIVDEAQDVMNFSDLERLERATLGGLFEGRWQMFFDPNRQTNVAGRFEPEALDYLKATGASPAKLTRNCRNTVQIVTQTRLYTAADIGNPIAGEGPSVSFPSLSEDEDPATALDEAIQRLVDEDISPGAITVLSPVDWHASSASRTRLARRGRLAPMDNSHFSDWPVAGITFAPIFAFKGMENSAVVLADLEYLADGELGINQLYVAMTRARAVLVAPINERTRERLAQIASENMNVDGVLGAGRK